MSTFIERISISEINRFSKLRLTRSRWLQHLHFLTNCKSNKIIPNFIKVKCNLKTTFRIKKTLFNCQLALLRAVIKDTRSQIAKIEREIYPLHLKLAKYDPSFFLIDQKTSIRTLESSLKHRKSQDRKFTSLLNSQRPITQSTPSIILSPIINLSSSSISPTQEQVLSLNSNFSIARKIPNERIIAPVEKAFKYSKLLPSQKEVLRAKLSDIVEENNKNKIKSNLTHSEKQEFSALKSNPNIVISKADKGGQTVIMDKSFYQNGIENLLHEGPYRLINADPSQSILKKCKTAVKECKTISEKMKSSLTPSISNCARFYALPKIHKTNVPFRPIVSNTGTSTLLLSKFLVSRFSPLSKGNLFTVKNSVQFVQQLQSVKIEDCNMASFDVKSLYTNVPITGALTCLTERMAEFNFPQYEIEELINLTQLCLSNTTFTCNSNFYQQTDGLAMGNPLSPILSDIYMHYFELKLFKQISFHFWKRYVDDTFVLFKQPIDELPQILNIINSIDPNIQFTAEIESNNCLPFLDVLVTKSSSDLQTSIYRKPFAIVSPPHNRSAHPFSQKMASFYTLVHRAIHICSNENELSKEICYLKAIAENRGYNPNIINKALKKFRKPAINSTLSVIKSSSSYTSTIVLPFTPGISHKIAQTLKKSNFRVIYAPLQKLTYTQLKDPIPEKNSWGIYQIYCECNLSYIGQTKRALHNRIKEHEAYVRKQQISKSSIAQHCWTNNHNFKFSDAKLICKTTSIAELDFLEAYHIHRNSQFLVNDNSSTPFLSRFWFQCLSIDFS